jgi:pimeloyl-ACP methyl ester carboxylesterase
MGGGVASATAALYPDLVGGVVLEDPAWLPESDPKTRAERSAEWRKTIIDRQALTAEQVIANRKTEMPLWADEFPTGSGQNAGHARWQTIPG